VFQALTEWLETAGVDELSTPDIGEAFGVAKGNKDLTKLMDLHRHSGEDRTCLLVMLIPYDFVSSEYGVALRSVSTCVCVCVCACVCVCVCVCV
jgi:hypothetical protein